MRWLGRAWQVSLAVAVVMAISISIISMVGAHAWGEDFGLTVEELLNAQSNELFGIKRPLSEPADAGDVVPREDATANERQLLAQGLKAQFIARNVAFLGDTIAFWPDDINYTHLIVCIEQERSGTTPEGNEGLNTAVQRVEVETGDVETILHGMSRCDGIRATQ
jgi:hypothetical protein